MPHMDGRELADRLRVRMPGLKVLSSGYMDDARCGGPSGQRTLLLKPFTPSCLHRVRSPDFV
jgi:CheY-like chemotaxis protein